MNHNSLKKDLEILNNKCKDYQDLLLENYKLYQYPNNKYLAVLLQYLSDYNNALLNSKVQNVSINLIDDIDKEVVVIIRTLIKWESNGTNISLKFIREKAQIIRNHILRYDTSVKKSRIFNTSINNNLNGYLAKFRSGGFKDISLLLEFYKHIVLLFSDISNNTNKISSQKPTRIDSKDLDDKSLPSLNKREIHNIREKLIEVNNYAEGLSKRESEYKNNVNRKLEELTGRINKINNIIDENNIIALKNQLNSLFNKIKNTEIESLSILDNIKSTAKESAIIANAQFFEDECKSHNKHATFWGLFTGSFLFLLVGFSIYLLAFHEYIDVPMSVSIQLSIARGFVFAALAFGAYFSAKNYMTHRHNSIVNKHRQNILSTFKALADGASNDEEKDFILKEATKRIFEPQSSGCSGDGKLQGGPSAVGPIVELLNKK